ncbi:MAG: hypothetical protein IIA17_11525, partial [candidate division Zixibacteria bacterium]|nr:hypothetical protein [candidate division Zixibacteria bacterium]
MQTNHVITKCRNISLLAAALLLTSYVILKAAPYPNQIIDTISVGSQANPSGLALTSDDNRLFVSHWLDDFDSPITEHDIINDSLIQTITFGGFHTHGGVVLTPDDRYLFTTNYYPATVSRIDLQNSNARIDLPAGSSWPWGLSITPDGSKIVVKVGLDGQNVDMNNDLITIIDVATFTTIGTIILNDEPSISNIGFSSDGTRAYV